MSRVVVSEGMETVGGYLGSVRSVVLEEFDRLIPSDPLYGPLLYDLMRDYPLRSAKMLRPALAISACRALGGHLDAILPTAASIELYHNAFLIHDDVEDGSEMRRDKPTLHRLHGAPVAINVGDGMLALTLYPLLENTQTVGVGGALRVLRAVADMARHSAEGQALELHWIRNATWGLSDEDYLLMVEKKTTWYTFITPLLVGAIAAGRDDDVQSALKRFALALGAAFQITDDVLNLDGDPAAVGKEWAGDLWEGKRTLILLHALREMADADRQQAIRILGKARGPTSDNAEFKTSSEVEWLHKQVVTTGGIEYAMRAARTHERAALRALEELESYVHEGVHQRFLRRLVGYVVSRDC